MRAEIDNKGFMHVNIFDVIHECHDEETLKDIVQALSCNETLFELVAQQIIQGLTDEGWSTSSCSTSENPVTPLDQAQRYVAKHASITSEAEITSLEWALKCEKDENKHLNRIINYMRKFGCERHYESAIRNIEKDAN